MKKIGLMAFVLILALLLMGAFPPKEPNKNRAPDGARRSGATVALPLVHSPQQGSGKIPPPGPGCLEWKPTPNSYVCVRWNDAIKPPGGILKTPVACNDTWCTY